ncbi:hypothetical protein FKP32DRAFT_1679750, partial [Trametes sanguinea]
DRLLALEAQIGGVRERLEGLDVDALHAQVAAVSARMERFDELQSQVAQIRDMLARVLEQRAA